MILSIKNLISPIVLGIALVIAAAPLSHADVVVFDRVTTVKTPIRITVLTKERFFSAGGRLRLLEIHAPSSGLYNNKSALRLG